MSPLAKAVLQSAVKEQQESLFSDVNLHPGIFRALLCQLSHREKC